MPERFHISVDGHAIEVYAGTSVAVAMLRAEKPCRVSVTGEPRSALCGMGICFECRAVVDGVTQRRTCQLACSPGMRVETQP